MRHLLLGALVALALAGAQGPAGAVVQVGDPAPDFTKSALDGGTVSRSDYSGKIILLFLFGYG